MVNVKRPCGCICNGCIKNLNEHCLTPPCTRKRNKRSVAQVAEAERHPGGLIKKQRASRSLSQEEKEARARERQIKEALPPRVTYSFVVTKPPGKILSLYADTEEGRENMIASLEKHGWHRELP